MRDDVALPESALHKRLLGGVILTVLGAGSIVLGFVGEGGQGALLVGVGAARHPGRRLVDEPGHRTPVIRGLGFFYRKLFGTVGVLARRTRCATHAGPRPPPVR